MDKNEKEEYSEKLKKFWDEIFKIEAISLMGSRLPAIKGRAGMYTDNLKHKYNLPDNRELTKMLNLLLARTAEVEKITVSEECKDYLQALLLDLTTMSALEKGWLMRAFFYGIAFQRIINELGWEEED